MKCTILHDTAGRLRVHLCCKRMTLRQADVLEYYLLAVDGVRSVKVYDRTRDAVVVYDAERERMIRALARFSFEKAEKLDLAPEHTSRTLNREFEDKLALTVMRRCASNLFLPAPVTSALAVIRSAKYIKEGLLALWHRKLSVAVLDATAVTVSMVRGDFATAGSVNVHAAAGGNFGGVDPQEVRGRPCLRHELTGRKRLAAGRRHRGADEGH